MYNKTCLIRVEIKQGIGLHSENHKENGQMGMKINVG